MANQQFDERTLFTAGAEFVIASGTDPSSLYPGAEPGSRIDAILAANYDSVDHGVIVTVAIAGSLFPVASATVPAAVGGKPSVVEMLSASLPLTYPALILGPDVQLSVRLAEAVTDDATRVFVTACGGTF